MAYFRPSDIRSVEQINVDLERMTQWALENSLCLNPAKSNAIWFGLTMNTNDANLCHVICLSSGQIPYMDTKSTWHDS